MYVFDCACLLKCLFIGNEMWDCLFGFNCLGFMLFSFEGTVIKLYFVNREDVRVLLRALHTFCAYYTFA